MNEIPTAERIVAAARWLLLEKGADDVTMRRVAEVAGISAMAIYRHFPNREALLHHVADDAFGELVERWNSKPRSEAADARLHEMLDDHLDFGLAQPRLYDYVFTERRDQARKFPEDFRARRSPTFTLLADAIADGQAQGIFREGDVWELALMVAAFLHGLIQLYHGKRIDMSEVDFRELCHSLSERMIDGFRT